MAAWDKSGKEKIEKREKRERGKREIIFSKSLFLKISPNIKPHKIPVLSSDFPDLAKPQESAADHKRGGIMSYIRTNIT